MAGGLGLLGKAETPTLVAGDSHMYAASSSNIS
jgi:hypothetical protein